MEQMRKIIQMKIVDDALIHFIGSVDTMSSSAYKCDCACDYGTNEKDC